MGCDRLIVGSDDAHYMEEEQDEAARMEQRHERHDSSDEQKRDGDDGDGVTRPPPAWRNYNAPDDPVASRFQNAHTRSAAVGMGTEDDDFSDDTDIEEGMSRSWRDLLVC